MNKELPKHIEGKVEEMADRHRYYILTEDQFDDTFRSYDEYVESLSNERTAFKRGAKAMYSLLSASTEQGTVEERAKEYANKEADQNDYTVAVTEALELAYINGYNSASIPNPSVQELVEKLENAVRIMKDRRHDTAGLGAPIQIISEVLSDLKSLQSQSNNF